MRSQQSMGASDLLLFSSSDLSVLINPKDPHAVQLGQFGDEHGEQRNCVDHKMGSVIFGVEAG